MTEFSFLPEITL